MAQRPVYIPRTEKLGVETKVMEFEWFPGFSVSQKQKSIRALHKAAEIEGASPILEISSKSEIETGVKASAFNLMIAAGPNNIKMSVESAFQGSKYFQHSGPFQKAYDMSAREARKEVYSRKGGELSGFRFFDQEFPLEPKTYFYDWLYITALSQNPGLAEPITGFAGFTDIEFNPKKAINCQAYAAALFVSLRRQDLLGKAISSPEAFLGVVSEIET